MELAEYRDRVDGAVGEGRGVAATSTDLRNALRRKARPGSEQRQARIDRQLERIDAIMVPIRSLLGGLLHYDLSDRAETGLRETSRRLQYERKQLRKMSR